MIKAVAFDAFGTLLRIPHPQYPHLKFLSEAAVGANFDFNRLLTRNYASARDMAYQLGCYDDRMIEVLERDIKAEVDSSEVFPEAIQVLDDLKKSGFKLALISNLSFEYQQPIVRLGLESCFNVLKYSFRSGSRKPEAKIFREVAEELNVDLPEILMVGDSFRSDYSGATALGMSALLLDRRRRTLDFPARIDDLRGVLEYLKLN